jgi:hypothetical protein
LRRIRRRWCPAEFGPSFSRMSVREKMTNGTESDHSISGSQGTQSKRYPNRTWIERWRWGAWGWGSKTMATTFLANDYHGTSGSSRIFVFWFSMKIWKQQLNLGWVPTALDANRKIEKMVKWEEFLQILKEWQNGSVILLIDDESCFF